MNIRQFPCSPRGRRNILRLCSPARREYLLARWEKIREGLEFVGQRGLLYLFQLAQLPMLAGKSVKSILPRVSLWRFSFSGGSIGSSRQLIQALSFL